MRGCLVGMRSVAAMVLAALCSTAGVGFAASGCPGNPGAIGTSRVLAIDPKDHERIGSMQYPETLPLRDKEVVLTFDDGPLPRYTGRILESLADECVKATFFLVGSMANAYPEWVRRIHDAGHTVATHSYSHPRYFRRLSYEKGVGEIDRGIAAVKAALGERPLAPFFRFPGFGSTRAFETYLAERGLMTWGADVPADDWKHISADKIIDRALHRLSEKGRGILLLHDIQPATALALPRLLRELKQQGFRIVHVVPAGPGQPKTIAPPEAWASYRMRGRAAASVAGRSAEPAAFSVPSALSFGFPYPLAETIRIGSFDGARPPMDLPQAAMARVAEVGAAAWPSPSEVAANAAPVGGAVLPPSLGALKEPGLFGGQDFTPRLPESGDQAAMRTTPKPAKLATASRRPRPPRLRAGEGPRQTASGQKMRSSWARSLNWIYTQPQ